MHKNITRVCGSTKFLKGGFTFMEVLIALAIFGIAGIACLEAYLFSTRRIQMMDAEKRLVILSRRKIEELRMLSHAGEDLPERQSGIFPRPYQDYEWEFYISDNAAIDTALDLTFRPYKLRVSSPEGEYSTIMPFIAESEGVEI